MYFLLAYANTIAITKDVNVNRPTMDHNAARRDLRDEEEAMFISLGIGTLTFSKGTIRY